MKRKTVVFGSLGTRKDDRGTGESRWAQWRPTFELCTHDDFPVSRYELFYQDGYEALANQIKDDIEARSKTKVNLHLLDFKGDPWNLESVYIAFFDYFSKYAFANENVDYYLNISTGTHVMQICMFLLAEARFVPAKLVQSTSERKIVPIDLDLAKFDLIAQRFRNRELDDEAFLKDDIKTENSEYGRLIKKILFVSTNYAYPILLTGRTGVGKTSLATRIHELRKEKKIGGDPFMSVNCATLGGDIVRSELFGHEKGAFTGANAPKKGLLELANHGTLFLDEIGELDMEVQKMLLTALEDKEFRRLGAETKTKSDFYFIAGTNSDLKEKVKRKEFREDLLARIDMFHFTLPELKTRFEDIEPNLNRELQKFMVKNNLSVTMSAEARERYLQFAVSPEATWNNNFRDLSASVIRMGAYAENGRITSKVVEDEIECLRGRWQQTSPDLGRYPLALKFLGEEGITSYDLVEIAELEVIIETCLNSRSASDAGRKLYSVSLTKKTSKNDTIRVSNRLKYFGLDWRTVKDQGG